MKSKKLSLLIASMIVGVLLLLVPNKVNAETPISPSLYFGIQEFRNGTDPNGLAYAIKNPTPDTSGTVPLGAKIFQIVKYNSSTATTFTTGNYYCIRAGHGFMGYINGNTGIKDEYNISYDLKTERARIAQVDPNVLSKIVNNGKFDNLLALTDLLYLKGQSTTAERTALLEAAGIYADDYLHPIEDSDIEAVQQAAIWYYSNYDDSPAWANIFNEYEKTAWLFYNTLERSAGGEGYTSFSDCEPHQTAIGKDGKGYERQEQAELLYDYLIRTANSKASEYANGTAVPKTKVTLYTNATNKNVQPIIVIEKKEETRDFDLALRKYITKVGTETLSGNNSRVPNIDTSKLNTTTNNVTTTTAIYRHKKDPVVVGNGTVITYNLTVYNEGEKEGRATKIVDQLPTGLTFKKLNTAGFTASYDETTNRVTITRDASNTTNLPAYTTSGGLKSETIELECTVTATANTENAITLTNVAWISEEYDAVDRVTITNQAGKDRDSEPATTPNVNKDNMANYTRPNQDGYYPGNQDDDDYEKVIIPKLNNGVYNLILIKKDSKGNQISYPATFTVNGVAKQVNGTLTVAENVEITSANLNTADEYVIIETVAPEGYSAFEGTIKAIVTKKNDNGIFKVDNVTLEVKDSNNNDITSSQGAVNAYLGSDGNIYIEVKDYQFDLKLIKKVTEVNGESVPERLLGVDITKLVNGTSTTADYNMNKNPVSVKKGDIVKYTLRVYNEGEVDAYASEISEDIPEGLELVWSDKTEEEIDNDTTLSAVEKEAIKYNQLIWSFKTVNSTTNKVEMVSTDYLARGKGLEVSTTGANLIKAFDPSKEYKNTVNDKNPDYRELYVYMRVTAENNFGTAIRNEAAITEETDKNGNEIKDRDSSPKQWVKYEDDEDYDNVILQSFDLALRKFIIAVSNDDKIEEKEYLKGTNGLYSRAPIVDTSKLNTFGTDGKLITTAIYNHPKTPVAVAKNSYVVYMLRAYNEADIDGYASEIVDHLPPYLEYVDSEFNRQYGWTASNNGRTVTTHYLENSIIAKTTTDSNGKIVLSYREVPIMCKVSSDATGKLTNIAEITIKKDANKNNAEDRDSKKLVVLPSDSQLPSYKDDETGSYIPGQEDDDDFEKIIIQIFDLALRKFITGVNDTEIASRIPQVEYDSNGKITYKHPKDPVDVATNDIVTYTLRVYNEGEINGYASRISDDIPAGLEFLPNNEINKQYRWVMYDKDGKETTDVSKAVKITTDYLSKEQSGERGLLRAFNKDTESISFADVKVAFKVVEENGSSKIIINSAQISDDSDEYGNEIEDEDSTPDEWIEGEDDQDKEYIKLKLFDLALRKFITNVSGKDVTSRVPQVKYDATKNQITYEHSKEPVDVTTDDVVTYTLRVFNEGQIDGYASKVSDDIPNGLEFLPNNEINKQYRWVMYDKDGKETTDAKKAVKITTDYLSKEQGGIKALLKAFDEKAGISDSNPDYRDVKVAFKVIEPNGSSKIIINSAQISEHTDKNGKLVKDKDSTPDKWIEGEDDQDQEFIKLNYFDLALRKWVTQAIVIENGKETVTKTGHKAEDNPEQVVKVEIHKKKISSVTVKFRYSIRVTNEGDVAGYAKEITDYVPQGLKFVAKDNPNWKDEGNNVISTRQLQNKLLKPGESAEVEVLLTWINGSNNLGLKTNIAEISEDYNDKHIKDRDSIPDNQIPGEDDIDDAPVLLSVSTGESKVYYVLALSVLLTIAGGVILIKKFVL